jgi:hypothetical protein
MLLSTLAESWGRKHSIPPVLKECNKTFTDYKNVNCSKYTQNIAEGSGEIKAYSRGIESADDRDTD